MKAFHTMSGIFYELSKHVVAVIITYGRVTNCLNI